eukprot:g1006.t1
MRCALSVFFAAGVLAQYGPDPKDVPSDFLCEWRKLALKYSTALRPDSAAMVHDALQLDTYCNGSEAVPRADEALLQKVFPPTFPSANGQSIVVDGKNGDDSNAGTVASPLKTIGAAVAKARATAARSTVELRAGTYYMSEPLNLTEADSGLTLQNYHGEEAWLSGAQPIAKLDWEPWKVTNSSWTEAQGMNNANGCGSTSKPKVPNPPDDPACGCHIADSTAQCEASCGADTRCTSYTYHAASLGAPWAKYCCLRRDDVWHPYAEKGHDSGRKAPGLNIWVADTGTALAGDRIVTELRVDGARRSAARYPNADPEREFWPKGYLTSNTQFDPKGDWLNPTIAPKPNPAQIVAIDSPNRAWDDYFSHYGGGIGGTCSIYDPPFSYWCQSTFSTGCGGCFTWNIPSGFKYGDQLPLHESYTNISDAQFFAWRKAHWANWMFDIASMDAESKTITFGKGGFQGARGGPGSDWFVSNVLQELDDPLEFYFDRANARLFVYSNETAGTPPAAGALYEALQQHTLLRVEGSSMAKPAKDITIRGLGFRDTAPTYMEPHGVPSGGDWALERFGAIFMQNTEGATVDKCKVWRASGNGIMLSAYNLRPTITGSEFAWMGGSAIAAWGYTDEISDGGIHGIDGTTMDFPRYTLVEGNLFHEIGVWEKQSSAFFQAKTAQSTLRNNLVFNLGRAGFNFNDGFGGGDNVTGNVLFNTCRESSDHGPINSWDRQPFVTTIRNGTASTQMEWRDVSRNFIIANYGGSKQVDNDDGSLFWRVHDNYMQYGWSQKFKCGGIESWGNYKAFVDLGGKFDAGCTTHPGAYFYPNLWHNDTMIHLGDSDFAYRQVWGGDFDKTQVFNNTIYMQQAGINAMIDKSTLADFQEAGKGDFGTRQLVGYPSTAEITAHVQSILDGHIKTGL